VVTLHTVAAGRGRQGHTTHPFEAPSAGTRGPRVPAEGGFKRGCSNFLRHEIYKNSVEAGMGSRPHWEAYSAPQTL